MPTRRGRYALAMESELGYCGARHLKRSAARSCRIRGPIGGNTLALCGGLRAALDCASTRDRGPELKSPLGNTMKKFVMFATLCLGLGLLSGNAAAQQAELKRQLVGTWTFVS